MKSEAKPFTGWKFLAIMVGAFTIIIGVNLTLAFQAVATFPGLETKNSYVASQSFDQDRAAQAALGWDIDVDIQGDELRLAIRDEDGRLVRPMELTGLFGRPTHVKNDQVLEFRTTPDGFTAPVQAGGGNWNLRLTALTVDGVEFRSRVVIHGGQG